MTDLDLTGMDLALNRNPSTRIMPAIGPNDTIVRYSPMQHCVPREDILLVQEAVQHLPEVDIPVTHYIFPGGYARQGIVKKNTILVGRIHNYAHINVMSYGDITVLTEGGIRRLQGCHTIISGPGMKRVFFAHEDTMWITIVPTSETDLDAMESVLTSETYEDFLRFCELRSELLCLG